MYVHKKSFVFVEVNAVTTKLLQKLTLLNDILMIILAFYNKEEVLSVFFVELPVDVGSFKIP